MRDGAKVGIPESGFIAQELDQVQQQFNAEDWLKLVLKENPDRLEATPGKLLPVLVKAMQEMAQEIDQLRTEVDSLLGK
jgi:predicted RND superfamily exporter protein